TPQGGWWESSLGKEETPDRRGPAVGQREAVALVVVAEAAAPAGPRREVDVLLVDGVHADASRLALQEVDEVAGGEGRRAALADVRDLAAGQQIVLRGHRQNARVVARSLEHGLYDALGSPVQAAEEDGDGVALLPRERAGGGRGISARGGGSPCA